MKLFTEVKILEVEKGTKLEPVTSELRESLTTLQYQPAFQYLINKMRVQKAQVQKYLNEGFEVSEKELRYAQAGIFWLKWIEDEVNRLTKAPVNQARPAMDQELEEFNKIAANLDVIGAN